MRKVERLPRPDSLKQNAAKWTEELLAEIERMGSYSKVDDSYKNKYRQKDVQSSLEKMYKKHCCYCEAIVGTSSYGRIEHLKPKSLPAFYQYTFEWENMHWCCEICNTSYKKARWNFQHPISDPSKEEIEKFLKLNLATGEYVAIDDDKRAETTIEHTGMNREALTKARRKIIIHFMKDYQVYCKCGAEKEFCKQWEILKEDFDYPSLYNDLLDYVRTKVHI